jgi:acyl-CoA thioesterase FadM
MEFNLRTIVQRHHLDALGHVSFIGHQQLALEAHAEMLEREGFGIRFLSERGLALVMKRLQVDFAGQLFLGEEACVRLRATSSGARVNFAAEISRDGRVVSRPRYTMALCGLEDGLPKRPPPWFAEKFPAAEKKETAVTPVIACVDTHSKSVLPTGALKFEDGRLFQGANVIVHRADADEEIGFRSDVWLPVPDELVAAIRGS